MKKIELKSLGAVRERERERVSLYSTRNVLNRPHTSKLIEIERRYSRDRKNLLFCVMKN